MRNFIRAGNVVCNIWYKKLQNPPYISMKMYFSTFRINYFKFLLHTILSLIINSLGVFEIVFQFTEFCEENYTSYWIFPLGGHYCPPLSYTLLRVLLGFRDKIFSKIEKKELSIIDCTLLYSSSTHFDFNGKFDTSFWLVR